MTTEAMTVRPIFALEKGYHYEEVITTGATGSDVKIPAITNEKGVTCTLIAGANTGYFEVTTSTDAKVAAGAAVWQTWYQGSQTGTISDVLVGPVTGIRGVSSSGEITIEIVA